jgi:DNA mismatch endonuclease Vsr
LIRELRRLGLRFKRNVKSLPGKPDIVFPSERVAVFCDGDFWHGRNWRSLSRKLARCTNSEYWRPKIASNIRRDKRINHILKREEWKVFRVWENDITQNHKDIAKKICNTLRGHNGNKHRTEIWIT